jgi:hypothetical protein
MLNGVLWRADQEATPFERCVRAAPRLQLFRACWR